MKSMNWGKGLFLVITLFVIGTLSVVSYLISLDFFLVTNNHYEEGVDYQETINSKNRAEALEDPILVVFNEESESFNIVFPETLIGNVQGTVNLYRPSDSSKDQRIPLRVNTTGKQEIPAGNLDKGKWVLKIEWEKDGLTYLNEKTLVI